MSNLLTLPELPYSYEALEPIISKEIMELHHSKHHNAYITNGNKALSDQEEAFKAGNWDKVISLQKAIRFNVGGHINHALFWENLAPKGKGGAPDAALIEALQRDFGGLDKFKEKFTKLTVAIQGSGWGWLGYSPECGHLVIETTANQDPLLGTTGFIPLLGVDVWEHAYYLVYKNLRQKYVDAIWEIVDWNTVNKRHAKAKS